MGSKQTQATSLRARIAALFAETGGEAGEETLAYYEALANDAGSEFEFATDAAKRNGVKACDYINYADTLTHVGIFERRILGTVNKDGIANGCTFEFRRAA
jgi:predicted DsbA family dithiol-disulfide isomerase